jgi:hypothetical protein
MSILRPLPEDLTDPARTATGAFPDFPGPFELPLQSTAALLHAHRARQFLPKAEEENFDEESLDWPAEVNPIEPVGEGTGDAAFGNVRADAGRRTLKLRMLPGPGIPRPGTASRRLSRKMNSDGVGAVKGMGVIRLAQGSGDVVVEERELPMEDSVLQDIDATVGEVQQGHDALWASAGTGGI